MESDLFGKNELSCVDHNSETLAIGCTLFQRDSGPLSKSFELQDGRLVSGPISRAVSSAEPVTLRNMGQLADLINGLTPNFAICTGSIRRRFSGRVNVLTKCRMRGRSGTIARSADFLHFPTQTGLLLLDFDLKGMPSSVAKAVHSAGGLWLYFLMIFPELHGVGHVIRDSTSSGLYNSITGEAFEGSGGLHVYVLVKDVSDSRRTLKSMTSRMNDIGIGWTVRSKNGASLHRNLIDASVGSAERLIFEGAPVLIPPIAQRSRSAVASEGFALDTKAIFPCADAQPTCPPAERASLKRRSGKRLQHPKVGGIFDQEKVCIENSAKIENVAVFDLSAAERLRAARLWGRRLAFLTAVLNERGGAVEGSRNDWFWHLILGVAWVSKNESEYQTRLLQVFNDHFASSGWNLDDALNSACSVTAGFELGHLYRFKTARLIEDLGISKQEVAKHQWHLQTRNGTANPGILQLKKINPFGMTQVDICSEIRSRKVLGGCHAGSTRKGIFPAGIKKCVQEMLAAGFKQAELAALIGVNQSQISRWASIPFRLGAPKYAQALDVYKTKNVGESLMGHEHTVVVAPKVAKDQVVVSHPNNFFFLKEFSPILETIPGEKTNGSSKIRRHEASAQGARKMPEKFATGSGGMSMPKFHHRCGVIVGCERLARIRALNLPLALAKAGIDFSTSCAFRTVHDLGNRGWLTVSSARGTKRIQYFGGRWSSDCGQRGDALDLVREMSNMDFGHAAEVLDRIEVG